MAEVNDNLPDDILPEEECAVPMAKHEAGIRRDRHPQVSRFPSRTRN
jgi:hypothetical protein